MTKPLNEFENARKTPIESSQPYPTLSTDGWILPLDKKMDIIFSHYLTSQFHQTTYHLGSVKSLQYTTKENYSNPTNLSHAIVQDLEFILKPYFDSANVSVNYKQRTDAAGNMLPQVDYEIILDVIHGGYKWTKFKTIAVKDSKFEELVNINNGQVGVF